MKQSTTSQIVVRAPDSIYQIDGDIENGTFHGRWHFSFGPYFDTENNEFGSLRVFNDDTLAPGAIWPLHPHREIEVVTYCAGGEFRHEDEHGKGGILTKGWVQHTTVGQGMYHSEINNRKDESMRFIQMWFKPSRYGFEPLVEQKQVSVEDRTNKLLAIASNSDKDALRLQSDAKVFSSFLQAGSSLRYTIGSNRGAYFYVVEGGDVVLNSYAIGQFGAAKLRGPLNIEIQAQHDSELLLIEVGLV